MKVLVTGASGFVGREVVKQLLDAGDEVIVLTRNIAKAAIILGSKCKYVQWTDTNDFPPEEAFTSIDGVINLMGEGIADKRWDAKRKQDIYNSRVYGTQKIVEKLKSLNKKPKVFISTSAVGVYGDRGDEEIVESSSTGSDFLADVCKAWEAEAFKAKDLGMRVAILRVGVVIGRGGALAKMLPIFKLGAGGPLGSGKQFMSWIHVSDLAAMYIFSLKNNSVEGVLNATSKNPIRNKDFGSTLGKVISRPAFAPAPAFAIKLAFGEMSVVLLSGQRVMPKKFSELKFKYHYPTLEMALQESI